MSENILRGIVGFIRDESGPTSVEYAVMLALIVVVCIGAVVTLGKNSNSTFTAVGSTIGSTGS